MPTSTPVAADAAPARLKRALHWATRSFHLFLLNNAKTPFVWGTWDCALMAAAGVLVMTGIDIAADFRGKYSDQASSIAAMKTITGVQNPTVADAAAYCAAKHQLPELKYPLMAQRGDLVVLEDSGRVIAGLVHLSGRDVVCAGEEGLKRLPFANITRAWKV